MVCPKCGYMLDGIESQCPKCQGKGVANLQKTPFPVAPSTATNTSKPNPAPPEGSKNHHPDGRIGAAITCGIVCFVIGWNVIAFVGGTYDAAMGLAIIGGIIGFVIGLSGG